MRRFVPPALIAVLMLSACAPEAPGGGDAVPPADAPAGVPPPAQAPGEPQVVAPIDPAAPFKQDFVLAGTEPFWRVDVKGTTMVLTRPEPEPVVTGTGATLAATSGKATWTTQAMTATVTAKTCSDGMSDRVYSYEAEVKVGDLMLKGCGISAEDWAKFKPQ